VSYFFHIDAEAEHLETVAYYESKQPGLGVIYLSEFEKIMANICDSPRRNRIEIEPGIRIKNMEKFPFNILFREITSTVQVLAVAHRRRRPTYWLGRSQIKPSDNHD